MQLGAHTKSIMVIDDIFEGEYLYSSLINRLGYQIAFYDDPILALNAIIGVEPILVVTDVCLPSMDGYQVLEDVRRVFPTMPFLIVSALPSCLDRASRIQNCLVLGKPFENKTFRNTVRALLLDFSVVTPFPSTHSHSDLLSEDAGGVE